jgi:hypothetical protein
VIFSDETYIDICVSQSRFVRRRSEEPIRMAHTSQHRPFLRVMFWGAMHGNGTLQLVQVNGMMTSARYVTILQQTVVPFLEERPLVEHWTFQHDNAPSHKAAMTKKFLAENAMNVIYFTSIRMISEENKIQTEIKTTNVHRSITHFLKEESSSDSF